MKYTVAVEADNVARGRWMVTIRDVGDRLVGIPFRGASKRAAEDAAPKLLYAFEYGYAAARQDMIHMLPQADVVGP